MSVRTLLFPVLMVIALAPALAHAQTPTAPSSGPIQELDYDASSNFLNPDGSFIPPADRIWNIVVTWRASAPDASFEVFARMQSGGPLDPRGTVEGPGPEFKFEEQVPFFEFPLCYVVRLGTAEAEACRPEPPSSGGPPPPAGTPWPAPGGTRTTNAYEGSPPTTIVEISWDVLPGFTGVFEVQRAETVAEKYRPVESEWVTVATIPASMAVNGRVSFTDRVSFEVASQRPACYRVRTVINGETGPYTTQPSCAVLPPGAETIRTPLPPDAGTSYRADEGAALPKRALGAAILVLVTGLTLGVASRSRTRR